MKFNLKSNLTCNIMHMGHYSYCSKTGSLMKIIQIIMPVLIMGIEVQ